MRANLTKIYWQTLIDQISEKLRQVIPLSNRVVVAGLDVIGPALAKPRTSYVFVSFILIRLFALVMANL